MNNLSPEEAELYLAYLHANRPDIADEQYIDCLKEVADTKAVTNAGKALRERAENARKEGGFRGTVSFIGIMLGARGYEEDEKEK